MPSLQNPHKAPPGTPIRPDGTPVGSMGGGGRGAIWIALIVVGVGAAVFAAKAKRHRAAEDLVTRELPVVEPPHDLPVPAPVPAPIEEPVAVPMRELEPVAPVSDEPEVISEDDRCLDEVQCLLAEEPPECCDRYKRGGRAPDPALDSDDIKAGVGVVKKKVFACGDKRPGATGTVKVHCKVSPAGKVTQVDVLETPDTKLGACVAKAIGKARFRKSENGASFTYPFNF